MGEREVLRAAGLQPVEAGQRDVHLRARRRLAGTGVTATVLHPGVTNTAFGAEDTARGWGPLIAVMRPFMQSPERGAGTPSTWPAPPRPRASPAGTSPTARPRSPTHSSYDAATTARLWQVSADLVAVPAGHAMPVGQALRREHGAHRGGAAHRRADRVSTSRSSSSGARSTTRTSCAGSRTRSSADSRPAAPA